MVPINTSPTGPMMRDAYLLLVERFKDAEPTSIEAAFANWIYSEGQTLINPIMPSDFAVTNYIDVARLAFLIEGDPTQYAGNDNWLKEGLLRVAGRAIPSKDVPLTSFQLDAVALLGLSLGAKRIGGEVLSKMRDWMQSFIDPANKTTPAWKRIFFFATLGLAGTKVDERDIADIFHYEDIKLSLASKGATFFTETNVDKAYRDACNCTMTSERELPLAACSLQALYYICNFLPAISLSAPSIDQLIALLNNIPAGLNRWTWEEKAKSSLSTAQKWDLQNEYHIQNLVYFLLAPIFPDIEDEFYLEPAGQINPRADLGIPSLNVIIEIKFLRPGVSFAKMIEQVASDASLYFQKDSIFTKKYNSMIVFLWDDSMRTQEHHLFKHGVTKLDHVIGAVVVSRPGNMPTHVKNNNN